MSAQPIDFSSIGGQPVKPAIDFSSVGGKPAIPMTASGETPGAAAITGIKAEPPSTGIRDSIAKWAENVRDDIKNGTDVTGVGTVLKKMGAHGVYSGNSQDVGDFMASLPLGLLRTTKGAAEVTQPGQTWQGTKDIVGGAMEAATIPAAIGSPGEAELLASGVQKGASLLSKIGSAAETGTDEWRKINAAIGASKTAVRVGRNAYSLEGATTMPGRALADLGFDSATLGKMTPIEQMVAVAPKWKEAGQAVADAVQNATQQGKTLDVGESAFETLKKIANPDLQEKAIDAFNHIAREIGITNQRAATPYQAWQLRKALTSGARFGPQGDLSSLGGVRAQLYGSVSSDLKGAVDGLKDLDQHYSDLEAAMKSIQNGVAKFSVSEPELSTMQKVGQFAKNELLPAVLKGAGAGAAGTVAYKGVRALLGEGEP